MFQKKEGDVTKSPSLFGCFFCFFLRHVFSFSVLTWFAVDVFGFEVARFEDDERQRRVGRVVAERDEQLAAFVLQRRLQRLPKDGLLREIHLQSTNSQNHFGNDNIVPSASRVTRSSRQKC